MRPTLRKSSMWAVLLVAATAFGFATGRKSPGAVGGHPFEAKVKKQTVTAVGLSSSAALRTEQQLIVERLGRWQKGLTAQSYAGATASQTDVVAELAQISERTLRINWDQTLGTPIFMSGKRLQSSAKFSSGFVSQQAAADRAMGFMRDNKQLLRLENPEDEFVMMRSERDNLGMTHLRYQQVYRGLEVWGRDVVVHLNRDGHVESFNGRYIPTPVGLGTAAAVISEAAARATAEREFGKTAQELHSRRLIYVNDQNDARVAYLVNVKGALDENWMYFIEAQTGAVLHRYNHVIYDGPAAGSGTDLDNQTRNISVYQIGAEFFLIDASKPMFNAAASNLPSDGRGVIYSLDAKNGDRDLYYIKANSATGFNNPGGISALANGAAVFDYYNQKHSRNAIDGKGTTMNLIVNFKTNFNNAFWNGSQMVFGNGDGSSFRDLAASYDVTGHEMTHGVVEHTANLVYENQPGALNESFADVFGTLFEFFARPATANYLMGEDVTTPNTAGDCLRNMEDPGAANVAFGGQQPTKMSEFRNLPNTEQGDNGGVHINSGIPNRAFVIIAKAIGNDKAETIYYRALSLYLTRTSQFIDARLAVVKAAEDLHGAGSAEANVCKSAFDTVEIFGGSATPPPQPEPPVQGNEYLAVVNANDLSLHRIDLNAETIGQLTATPVRLFSRPTVSDDGSTILFVDSNNFIRVIGSDGQGEQVISTEGIWSAIALSPNGTKLAANTIAVDTTIYIFDLTNSANNKAWRLYTPTYSGEEHADNVLYADVVEWASDNETVMYDAFNFNVDSNGDTLEFWDINLLRAADGNIERLFPAQPTGVDIGNPTFSSNSDFIMALDYVDPDGHVTVRGVNLNTGEEGLITNNFSSLGRPSFSRDDNRVYYHYITQTTVETYFVNLLADGITGDGQDQVLIDGYYLPTDFAIGSRPTGVDDKPGARPLAYTLEQNYPNPFNPETTIRYTMPFDGRMLLAIYDRNGRQVIKLDSGTRNAGDHVARWDGRDASGVRVASGVYFYRLEATSPTGVVTNLTKKMTLLK